MKVIHCCVLLVVPLSRHSVSSQHWPQPVTHLCTSSLFQVGPSGQRPTHLQFISSPRSSGASSDDQLHRGRESLAGVQQTEQHPLRTNTPRLLSLIRLFPRGNGSPEVFLWTVKSFGVGEGDDESELTLQMERGWNQPTCVQQVQQGIYFFIVLKRAGCQPRMLKRPKLCVMRNVLFSFNHGKLSRIGPINFFKNLIFMWSCNIVRFCCSYIWKH